MLAKPADVFDREEEWSDLEGFASSQLAGLRIAVVYGRRRHGKSYLLRRLAEASHGLYHLATEQTETISLRRFADALCAFQKLPEGSLSFDGWEAALNAAAGLMVARAEATGGSSTPPLLVLDEFPYLVHETPGLPSIVQSLYDRIGPGAVSGRAPLRLILCGSAISVMSSLLSGTQALRGRGALELRVKPFGYREARAYWDIEHTKVAFQHNALIGGTPGYRELVPHPTIPRRADQLGHWLVRNVLRPSVPLFNEAHRVVHEDPRVRDAASYGSVLATVAAGESSATKIGGLLGRPATSLAYQLGMLESTGFLERSHDLLLRRRPVISIADPIVRLHHVVIEPYLSDFEAGRAQQIWNELAHTIDSKIFGPHFEAIAREWVTRYAGNEADLDIGVTGQTNIACRQHRISHEIDVIALARGEQPQTAGATIALIGEAKHRSKRTGVAELHRLEHLRELLTAAGYDAARATLSLFSAASFTDELVAEAARKRPAVLLADLARLYG